MCGIAGVYNLGGGQATAAQLAAMSGVIRHRGPDDEGFYQSAEGRLGFAFRRLAILDLSPSGHQPMAAAGGRYRIIFNGEFYNYKEVAAELARKGYSFRSTGDTEVLVNAYAEWGPACLSRLNGMFAFALWDEQRQHLLIARDRMGIKPLYYWYDAASQSLVFGSEIKAILQDCRVPREPDPAAIAEYARFMYVTSDRTWFAGIRQLPPGCYLELGPETEGLQVRRWWDLPSEEDGQNLRSEDEYITDLRALLRDAVKLHLRSDVPVGAHLSGGLDSSSIVALVSNQLQASGAGPLKTFSGAFAEGAAYDERAYINLVANRYQTDHHETIPSAADLPAVFDKLIWHMDYPTVGPGLLPQYFVCKLTAENGVIVVNGGQGGDELFAGYFRYVPPYLRGKLATLRQHPAAAAGLLADAGRIASRAALRDLALNRTRRKIVNEGNMALLVAEAQAALPERDPGSNPGSNPLQRALYWDMRNYLPALLHVEDRTSMSVSLESRVPLLDYRIVELAARIPAALKLKGLETKRIMRRAVAPLLPPQIVQRRDKKGFPTPIDLWFSGPLYEWVCDQLTDLSPTAAALLDQQHLRQLLREQQQHDHSRALWMALSINAWCRQFIDDFVPFSPTLLPTKGGQEESYPFEGEERMTAAR